jgi:hypothetical protein
MFSFFKRTASQLGQDSNNQSSAPLLTPESEAPPSVNGGVKFEEQGARLENILSVIETSQPKRLVLVLKELVKKAPDATIPVVLEQLFAVDPTPIEAENGISNGVNDKDSMASDGPAKKRKRSNTKGDADEVEEQQGSRQRKAVRRYEICKNCKEEYDVTKHSKTVCRYHTGNI